MVRPLRRLWVKMRDANTIWTRPNSSKLTAVATVVLAALLSSAAASAGEIHTHDGFHLRFGVGLVGGASTVYSGDTSLTFGGPGLLDGVQVGGSPIENLSIFFEADCLTLFSANTGSNKDGGLKPSNQDGPSFYGLMTGVGVGYYFMPQNIYVSGAVGAAFNRVSLSDDGVDFNTQDMGFGFTAMAGKEWWVSDNWGVGMAGQFLYLQGSGRTSAVASSHTVAFGLILTATYN